MLHPGSLFMTNAKCLAHLQAKYTDTYFHNSRQGVQTQGWRPSQTNGLCSKETIKCFRCTQSSRVTARNRLVTAGKRLAQLKRVFYGADKHDAGVVATPMLASALSENGFREHARQLQVRAQSDARDTTTTWRQYLALLQRVQRSATSTVA